MPHIKFDQLDGATLRRSRDGDQAVRIARVAGLAGPPADRLHAALNLPSIPQPDQPHPTIKHLVVDQLDATLIDADAARIEITYKRRDNPSDLPATPAPTLSIGSTLTQSRTSLDRHGRPITVTYENPAGDTTTQTRTVNLLTPTLTLTFTRVQSTSPLTLARHFTGCINATPIFDAPAYHWLCASINADQRAPTRFDVTYTFRYREQGWQPQIAWIDPRTSQPPADLITGRGITHADLYTPRDFHELRLT